MTPLGILLHGVGLILAIKETVSRPELKESALNSEAKVEDELEAEDGAEVGAEDFEEEEEQDPNETLFPDHPADLNLSRPALGSQQGHATILMEQAAALGALKDGLRAAGFDEDEAWHLTREYAGFWWASIYERDINFNDNDDD